MGGGEGGGDGGGRGRGGRELGGSSGCSWDGGVVVDHDAGPLEPHLQQQLDNLSFMF